MASMACLTAHGEPMKLIMTRAGFTLIELLVVMSIISLLLTIAVPKYFHSIDKAKEATLHHDLNVMRESIDKFYGDQGRYPSTLEELVERKYIRAIPADPITGSNSSWLIITPEEKESSGVFDIHSGAEGTGQDGSRYSDW